MKKLIIILLFFLIIFTSCKRNDIYSLKTDLDNYEKVEELVKKLDWREDKICDVKIKDKNIKIYFENAKTDIHKENYKPYLVNGIYLLILTNADEILYYSSDENFFTVDTEIAEIILDANFKKSLNDYKNSKEDFNNLRKGLKNYRVK